VIGPRTAVIAVDSKTFVRTRIYAVRNRLYQLLVVGDEAAVSSKDAQRFLESLRLAR